MVVPRLARDVVALLLYVLVVATVLRYGLDMNVGGLLAGTAVVTVVVGFALQETLGALLAGLALAWEQRLEAGAWVEIDGIVGEVEELGWRSLVLRTRLGERVLIPNSQVARARTHLYGEGEQPVAVPVRLGVAYGAAPLRGQGGAPACGCRLSSCSPTPAPQILVREFADSAVVYECRLWTQEPWQAADLIDAFLTRAHAALARAGMEIPFPQRSVHLVAARLAADPVRMSRDALAAARSSPACPTTRLRCWQAPHAGRCSRPARRSCGRGGVARAVRRGARRGRRAARRRGGRPRGRGRGVRRDGVPLRGAAQQPRCGRSARLRSSRWTAARSARAAREHRELAEELANRMASRQQELAAREAMAGAAATPKGLASFLLERLLRLVGGMRAAREAGYTSWRCRSTLLVRAPGPLESALVAFSAVRTRRWSAWAG